MVSDSQTDRPDRAVSPVIGVILMIAVTVILGAVVATLVMDIGTSNPGPLAAYDAEADGNDTTVTAISIDRLDAWDATCGTEPGDLSVNGSVGTSTTVTDCSPENVTIYGQYDGKTEQMAH